MVRDQSGQQGWREAKRRQTLQRITDSALRLFVADGYEATTLDAITEAAGISRRTFFYYFKSKEEILAAWLQGLPEFLRAAVLEQSTDQSPLEVVRNVLLKKMANFNARQALVIDRILRSNEQLRALNQARYLSMEQAVFEALCKLWPQTRRRQALRVVAMASIGAMRLAIDNWVQGKARRPLGDYLQEAFASLKAEL